MYFDWTLIKRRNCSVSQIFLSDLGLRGQKMPVSIAEHVFIELTSRPLR